MRMMLFQRKKWLLPVLLILATNFAAQAQRGGNPLPRLLQADTARFGRVLRNPAAYRLQVLYTQINRDAQGRPHFRTFRYGAAERQYFYPASTVKLPAAVLALAKLRRLRAQVPGLTAASPLRIGVARTGLLVAYRQAVHQPSPAQPQSAQFIVQFRLAHKFIEPIIRVIVAH